MFVQTGCNLWLTSYTIYEENKLKTRFQRLGLVRSCQVCFCALFLAACPAGIEKNGLMHYSETQVVSPPDLELPAAFATSGQNRIKVASLTVSAPKKGEQLLSKSILVTRTGAGTSSQPLFADRGDYFYEEDLAPGLRELFTGVFEIDADAESAVTINAAVDVNSRITSNFFCKPWVTSTNVTLKITVTASDDAVSEYLYAGEGEDTYCSIASTHLPVAGSIEETIEEAFAGALETMAQDFSSRN